MTGYEMLSELLDLPGMYVTGYKLKGADEITLQIESVSPAAVYPACQSLSTECRDRNEGYFCSTPRKGKVGLLI